MNEVEVRKFCIESSITILSWYKGFRLRGEQSPIVLADIIYQYITNGKVSDIELPLFGGKGKDNRD